MATPEVSKNFFIPSSGTVNFNTQGATSPISTDNTVKSIPLVDNDLLKNENKGLAVETTTKPSLDTQTMRWFKLTKEQWVNLSDEQKQEKADLALKGMVDAYNKEQIKKGSHKRLSYAEQMKLYRERYDVSGEDEQIMRLTRTVKSFHGKDQIDMVKNSYQYKDKHKRDVTESTIAVDYTDYDKENVVEAAKETENFSEQNQIIAADNASRADVSLHKELVDVYMGRDIEPLQLALSNHIGEFGVGKDGLITEEGKEIQFECFKAISSSDYQSVKENSASNIYTMDKDNQAAGVNYIVSSGNEGAIKAAAAKYDKYDDSVKNDVSYIINNSDCDSAKATLQNAQESSSSAASEKTTLQTVQESSSSEKETLPPSSSSSSEGTGAVEKLDTILKSNNTSDKTQIAKVIKNASQYEKLKILNSHSDNIDVINALLASNPSLVILSKIIGLLNDNNKFSEQDRNGLMNTIADSGAFKGANSRRLGSLSSDLQILYIQKLSPENLKDINSKYLLPTAKDIYDKRLEELNKKEEAQSGVKKFGILGRK